MSYGLTCVRPTGFEPATRSLTAKYQISSPPMRHWFWRGMFDTAFPPCGGRFGFRDRSRSKNAISSPPPNLATDPGNRRNLRRRRSGKRDLLLIYGPPCWTRRELHPRLVVGNEVTDFFTTGSELALSGNRRERFQPRHRKTLRSEPASRQPSRGRLHGTMHVLAGFEPAFPRSEVSALFTTDKLASRGTAGAALVLETKNSSPSPPGI